MNLREFIQTEIKSQISEAKDMTFVDYLKVLDSKFLDGMKAVRGDNGSDAAITPTRGDILQNFKLFRNYLSALTKKYKGDKTKLRFISEHKRTLALDRDIGTSPIIEGICGFIPQSVDFNLVYFEKYLVSTKADACASLD